MKNHLLRLLTTAGLLLATSLAHSAPVLIVNKNAAEEKIDANTVKAMFLGKKVAWNGAGRVTLAVLKAGPVAEEFLKGATDLNVTQFNNHWRRLAMTGGGTAPKSFDKEEDLRRFVAETPGAIGFVEQAAADATVVVLVVP